MENEENRGKEDTQTKQESALTIERGNLESCKVGRAIYLAGNSEKKGGATSKAQYNQKITVGGGEYKEGRGLRREGEVK